VIYTAVGSLHAGLMTFCCDVPGSSVSKISFIHAADSAQSAS